MSTNKHFIKFPTVLLIIWLKRR